MHTEERARTRLLSLRQEHAYWATRIETQLAVADKLFDLHPAKREAWRPLLAEAHAAVSEPASLEAACRRVETILSPLAETAKAYSVHCVGHAHIDMNWMWSWPETVHVVNDTFTTVLTLMDEYPEFCFSQSQASVYRILETYHPALLERVRPRVAEGRWEVTASHWVEGDKNMVSGESLCRHLLYTRRYMHALFGLAPEDVPVDWAPDTFGHAATVPTYLARGGVRYAYLHRPGTATEPKHEVFRWEGPDGSTILVRNDMRAGYNGRIDARLGLACLEYAGRTGLEEQMFVYGVGDHGGGPTRRDLECILDLAAWPIFPAVRFGTAGRFFAAVDARSDLPVFRGELNTEFAGCYTSQALIKRCNRLSEARLKDAEFAAALALRAAGTPYPAERLRESWQNALFTHFHDILPGSGVYDTKTFAHGQFQNIMAETSMIETTSLRALAARVDTAALAGEDAVPGPCPSLFFRSGEGGGAGLWTEAGDLSSAECHHRQGDRPFVVVNPTGWAREELVEVTLWDHAPVAPSAPLKETSFVALTPDGEVLPTQRTEHGDAWGHAFVKLAFPVQVPALGYATYIVRQGEPGAADGEPSVRFLWKEHHCGYAATERKRLGMENDRVRLELDPATGGIRRLVDLATGTVLIDEPASARTLEFGIEHPHRMSAWLIEHTGETAPPRVRTIAHPLSGPRRSRIDTNIAFGADSEFTLSYELREKDPTVYMRLHGRWGERGSPTVGTPALRARFPLNLAEVAARYEIPFGAVDRPFRGNEEMPGLRWVYASGTGDGGRAGLLLLNDCKHGFAVDGTALCMSLIRASYEPDPSPEIGMHEIRFALRPVGEELTVAEATRHASVFNHPLRVIGTPVHAGPLPPAAGGLTLEGAGLVLGGLKRTEDGEALLLRIHECEGNDATGAIHLDPEVWGAVTAAVATDLLERDEAGEPLSVSENRIDLSLPRRGILSVRIALSE